MGFVAGLPEKKRPRSYFCGRPLALVEKDYIIGPVHFVDFFCRHPENGSVRVQAFTIDLLGIFMDRSGFLLDKKPAFR